MEIKKILFLRPEHIGDYGMGLPVLKALRKKFPDAQIDVAVGPWNKKFAESTPYVDNVFVYDNPLMKRHLTYREIFKIVFSKRIFEIFGFIRKLNLENYDLLVSPSDRKLNKILLKFFKAKEKILGTGIRNTGFDERKRLEEVMAQGEVIVDDYKIDLDYSKEDKKVVEDILKQDLGFDKKILLHTLTPLPEKNWPEKNWKSLIGAFSEKNWKFYVIGSDDQKMELDKKFGSLNKTSNLAGKLNLIQAIYLMTRTDLIVGGDSGPVHLAEMTPIKIISLFGPTNEAMWGTPLEKGKVLKKERVEDITVAEVKNAIKEILK